MGGKNDKHLYLIMKKENTGHYDAKVWVYVTFINILIKKYGFLFHYEEIYQFVSMLSV
jgi:hypothetical protein